MTYTTAQLLSVSGATPSMLKQWITRRHISLSSGFYHGHGVPRAHTREDVLQAALIVQLGRVGIGPKRAGMVWCMAVVPNLHRPDALILFGPRDDDSDLDVRVVLPGQDDGLDRDDAPDLFAALQLGLFKRRVAAKLAVLEPVA